MGVQPRIPPGGACCGPPRCVAAQRDICDIGGGVTPDGGTLASAEVQIWGHHGRSPLAQVQGPAALKLNFTIPAPPDLNPFPDPGYDCMNPIPPVTAAGRLFDSGQNGISAYNQWSGARLWNVAVASRRPLAELAAPFDLVSVALSKGLGAPGGSLLAASRELIQSATL